MRLGFYPKLALTGIVKNKKTYFPYILTSIGMVMMLYIVSFLAYNDTVGQMPGGDSVQGFLGMGCWVIGIFSAILLFYTNSFLIRRRKKEFGLYNILGMGKLNLARILIWETVMIAVISVGIGLGCGILFSKVAELVVANVLNSNAGFGFQIKGTAVSFTVTWFAVIFVLILLNALRQIHLSNPIELLRSETVGEKPPKANWVLALIGLLLLGGAYYLAIRIENPVEAMLWFFVAVVMVILGTYLLFIAGSVVFCRLLQKNKAYYYSTNHFISVSSMVYRMKRNGAGLASICILSTMVLVMISSTSCLYIGREDTLRKTYPRNIVVDAYTQDKNVEESIREVTESVLKDYGETPKNILQYRYLDFGAYRKENQVFLDMKQYEAQADFANITQFFAIPLEDYNRIMGTSEKLDQGEALVYMTKGSFDYDTMTIEGLGEYKVRKAEKGFINNGVDAVQIFASIFFIVPDMEAVNKIYDVQASIYDTHQSYIHSYYGFDLGCDDETQQAITEDVMNTIYDSVQDVPVYVVGAAENRINFYALFGGFFILGIILGIVFICGAVLIMYYKQIIEGYEDQSRFEILQKVGMTKKEIRKSINSQILTVFFIPLLMAGLHTAFAFPLVKKMLLLFSVTNTKLLIMVTTGSFLIFAAFYILVYLVTSRAYYGIVSGKTTE